MKKFLNKKLTTPAEIAFGKKYEKVLNELKNIRKEIDENYRTYWKMEGKYSIGTIPTESEQGFRGYNYKYATTEERAKENNEREAYYAIHIIPLKTKKEKLETKIIELENQFCVLLYGYSIEHYNKLKAITKVKQKIKKLEEELTDYKEYLQDLEKEIM